MEQLRRFVTTLRNRSTHVEASKGSSVVLTQDDLDAIRAYLRTTEQNGGTPPGQSRLPTDEEIAIAAWANLAVEEPSVTLEEARRVVAELRSGSRQRGDKHLGKAPEHAGADVH